MITQPAARDVLRASSAVTVTPADALPGLAETG